MFIRKNINIALLANAQSVHAVRWANALAQRDYGICLITQHGVCESLHPSVRQYCLPLRSNPGYFLNAIFLRRLLYRIKPDLLHVHYASGYGTLGRLSGYHPSLLSVWGSDVYDFPYESRIKIKLLQKNLRAADQIASTSHVMAVQTHNVCPNLGNIEVTPFGIDTNLFKPIKGMRDDSVITIGTVKTLHYKYGIDTLIQGFAQLRGKLASQHLPVSQKLRLLIVGGGDDMEKLKKLAAELNISQATEFFGAVPYAQVPDYLNKLNVYVAVSRIESFGVAVLEASSCGLPVVVSDAGGLPEVVEKDVTGFIVPRDHPEALCSALLELVLNERQRHKMGQSGRERVLKYYTWEESVNIMERLYHKIFSNYRQSNRS